MAFEFLNFNNFNFNNFGNFSNFRSNFSFGNIANCPLFNFQPQIPNFFGMFQWNMPQTNIFSTPMSFNNPFSNTTPPIGNIFNNYNFPEINYMNYTPNPYIPMDFTTGVNFDSDAFFKSSKVFTTQPLKVSLTQKTDLKDVAAIYNKEKGIKLANEALAGLSNAQKGYCARAVKTAISDAGLGAYESGNANDIPDILRKNSNFKEVKVNGNDLSKLPAGCVIAYDKGAAGYSSKYGHVEIKGDGNQAISFFLNNNIKPSDNVTVFVPV